MNFRLSFFNFFKMTGKSVEECKSMYFRFKDEVFKGKAPYDVVPLERFLKKEFGDRTMADITGTK